MRGTRKKEGPEEGRKIMASIFIRERNRENEEKIQRERQIENRKVTLSVPFHSLRIWTKGCTNIKII